MTKRPHIDYYQPSGAYQSRYDAVLAYSSAQLPFDSLAPKPSDLVSKALKYVSPSGLVFVYGDPDILPYYAVNLEKNVNNSDFVFKYLIGVRTMPADSTKALGKSQKGLLLYASKHKFAINKVRVRHLFCKSCGGNLRDWGGKKHLMHPAGTALSDIWKDLLVSRDVELPSPVLQRVIELSPEQNPNVLLIRLPAEAPPRPSSKVAEPSWTSTKANKVVLDDCLEFMRKLPDGCVDLAFADPPYNLDKAYISYDDARHDEEYLTWCAQWLYEYQRILSPTGSLFIVNLPKWALHHKVFLDKYLYFQNWIVWDALSEPRGRLMPAHYAILYYTKHPTHYTLNREWAQQQSSEFCMRAKCVKERKEKELNDQVALCDMWWDIPRIKHKKYRDVHPCQLPEKLMERIIGLASKPGDLVFDGFCGTGTTAIIAKQMGRRYLTVDIDKYYVDLTVNKLELLDKCAAIPRAPTTKNKRAVTKKQLQLELLRLAEELGHLPTEEDVTSYSPYPLTTFLEMFPSFGKALRAAKVHQDIAKRSAVRAMQR